MMISINQNNPNNWYVKFVPFNENTCTNLTNKTIRFSTVFDFNDFNEENSYAPISAQTEIQQQVKKEIQNSLFLVQIIDGIKKSASINDDAKKQIFSYFEQNNIDNLVEKYWMCLAEVICYLRTGIYCLSEISVFKDDSAQLMFAHYGDNLKGLALIYEHTSNTNHLEKIDYVPQVIAYEINDNYCKDFLSGQKKEHFLNKSKKWTYEQEFRIFSKVGIHSFEEYGLRLRGIFYTSRLLNETSLTFLHNINTKFYGNDLFIKEVIRNFNTSEKYFRVYEDNNANGTISAYKFLEDINNKKSAPKGALLLATSN